MGRCLVAVLGACASERLSTPQVPTALVIISGNGQTDTIGATLAESLAVRVTAASGAGLSMVPIAWRAEGGYMDPETTATDQMGIARSRWTLGLYLGPARVIALVPGVALTDTFTAMVKAGRGVQIHVLREGPPWIVPADSLRIVATARDRLGNTLLAPAIQWSSSDPLVATVSNTGSVDPSRAPGEVYVIVHAVAHGQVDIAASSDNARDSVGVTVVRDTAAYGNYDLERRDSVGYPYCQYPSPIEVDCFSGSLTVDGVGGFVAKTFVVVTLIPLNQTLIDSSVTIGTYQAISTCELQLVSSGEPNGHALKSGGSLTVSTDPTVPTQHAWIYRGGSRPQTCL